MLTSESPPNMIRVCRWWLPKLRCCHSPLQKNPQCWSFPPRSQLRRCYWPFVFLTSKISPLQNVPSCPLLSYPLTFYTHTPLSIWTSWLPSPLAPKSPSSAWESHPSLLLLNLRVQLTPFSFQLASPPRIHMDSWWAVRNPNQGPNGPTTLPKTDLELTGLIHVGFGPQNY